MILLSLFLPPTKQHVTAVNFLAPVYSHDHLKAEHPYSLSSPHLQCHLLAFVLPINNNVTHIVNL